jgi:hypothetical protein
MSEKKRPQEEWRALVSEQRGSGQTQEAWCSGKGINLFTFRNWLSRLKKMDKESAMQAGVLALKSGRWMEVTSEKGSEKSTGLIIEHGGFTVKVSRGIDTGLLTEVLRAVSRSCC